MDERIGFGLYQSYGNRGVLDMCLCCGGVGGEWEGGLDQDLEGWCYVCVSPDSPNNSQILLDTQHTRQTDPLTAQHIKDKDITSHSPHLRSKKQ